MGDRFYSLDEVRELRREAYVTDPDGGVFLKYTPNLPALQRLLYTVPSLNGLDRLRWADLPFDEGDTYPWILGRHGGHGSVAEYLGRGEITLCLDDDSWLRVKLHLLSVTRTDLVPDSTPGPVAVGDADRRSQPIAWSSVKWLYRNLEPGDRSSNQSLARVPYGIESRGLLGIALYPRAESLPRAKQRAGQSLLKSADVEESWLFREP